MEQHEPGRATKRATDLRFYGASGLRLARYRHHKSLLYSYYSFIHN